MKELLRLFSEKLSNIEKDINVPKGCLSNYLTGVRGLSQENKDKLGAWLKENTKKVSESYFKVFPDEENVVSEIAMGEPAVSFPYIGKWLDEPLESKVEPIIKGGITVGLYEWGKLYSYSKNMKHIYFSTEEDALKAKNRN